MVDVTIGTRTRRPRPTPAWIVELRNPRDPPDDNDGGGEGKQPGLSGEVPIALSGDV